MTIQIEGMRELEATLRLLEKPASVRRAVRPAVRSAIVPLNKRVKSLIRKDTGTLRRSIGALKSFQAPGIVAQAVGPRRDQKFWRTDPDTGRIKKPENYALPLEKGTRTQPARSFLRKGAQQVDGEAKQRFYAKLRETLPKQVARERRRAGGRR